MFETLGGLEATKMDEDVNNEIPVQTRNFLGEDQIKKSLSCLSYLLLARLCFLLASALFISEKKQEQNMHAGFLHVYLFGHVENPGPLSVNTLHDPSKLTLTRHIYLLQNAPSCTANLK